MINKTHGTAKKNIKIFSSRKNRTRSILIVSIIAIIILAVAYFSKPIYHFFTNPDEVRDFIIGYGASGPLVLIGMQILQVLFAPIPGQAAGFISGYIYGVLWGTVYSMIGTLIGSFIAFALVRKFGRPFVEKVVEKHTLDKFDSICRKKGAFALFLIWLLPALPDDALCFAAGLTKIKIRILMAIVFLGRLPGFIVLNMIGNGVATANSAFSILLLVILMVASFAIFKAKDKIENLMYKMIDIFKKNKTRQK